MSFSHVFSVPAYYPNFRCKAGDCRHTCCSGWGITISMKEYFNLLGMDCSPELRRRLDTAFHPVETPSEERYATISPRWDGDCPLHLPNGYCGLQCEHGEGAIPSVCRYYPRSPKTYYAYQCQCANSCEGVVEQLFAYREPMTFLRHRLTFTFNETQERRQDALAQIFPAVQRACLHILQDRSRPLSHRLQHLGEFVTVMDIPYRQGNADGVRAVLPLSSVIANGKEPSSLTKANLKSALHILQDLLHWTEQNNEPLQDELKSALEMLCMTSEEAISDETVALWEQYDQNMKQLFPENERMLEQLFVNHLCYDSFPFGVNRTNLWDSFLAFITAYALIRSASICHMAAYTSTDAEGCSLTPTEAYADIVAAVFRMVEHTNFAHNAPILARRFAYDTPTKANLLCYL